MARVLVTGRIPQPGIDLLEQAGHEAVVWAGPGPMPRGELLRSVKGVSAVVSLISERIDAEVLTAAGPSLRVVSNVAVGYNNIDVPACSAAGVVVTNTPGVLTDATADIAMALILMVTRRLAEGERLVRSGRPWGWSMFTMLGTDIRGRQLGVVGMGQIGTALARRARAFGMSVVYSNRGEADPAAVSELGARRVEMDELFATSDVVSLHCPYTAETRHLVSAARLRTMKQTAYLVNTSRGPVVDEEALVDALASGVISGAGLDVFEHEPEVHPGLLERDDVVLLPHLGSATVETRTGMAVLAARNTVAVLAGQPPLTAVRA